MNNYSNTPTTFVSVPGPRALPNTGAQIDRAAGIGLTFILFGVTLLVIAAVTLKKRFS